MFATSLWGEGQYANSPRAQVVCPGLMQPDVDPNPAGVKVGDRLVFHLRWKFVSLQVPRKPHTSCLPMHHICIPHPPNHLPA